MKQTDLKKIIAEEVKKLREAMPLPPEEEYEDLYSGPEYDEYMRAIEAGDIEDPYAISEDELPVPITVEVRGGPVLTWNIAPEMDVFVATLDAQRQIFGEDSLAFVGPNAEEAEEAYIGAAGGSASVNEGEPKEEEEEEEPLRLPKYDPETRKRFHRQQSQARDLARHKRSRGLKSKAGF